MISPLANVVGDLTCGKNCRIDPYVTITGKVRIGNNVHIGVGVCIFGGFGVEVGDDASLSPGSKVFTSSYDATTGHLANPQLENKDYSSGPVFIGKRSILGANSVVLPNVKIADDVLVGALSLVNKDLETKSIYAGSPVRKIRNR